MAKLKKIIIKNNDGQIIDWGYAEGAGVMIVEGLLTYYRDESATRKATSLRGQDSLIVAEPTQREWDVLVQKNMVYLKEEEAKIDFGRKLYDHAVMIAIEYLKKSNGGEKVQGN